MRIKDFYIPTLRDAPSDAVIPSDKLLRRGGFVRPLSAGIFSFLPLGYRVLRRVEQIVREEMNAASAAEVFLPVLQPRELWERSGRWESFAPTPLRVTDRNGREFCLGPTHEENITALVADDVTSYKQLPMTLYQIQTKFRDEMRPRGGLIRVKEFMMKDAYSFDIDRAGLDVSYQKMYDAYVRIFERVGLSVEIVKADAGSMGGFDTREFALICEHGEDTVYKCGSCGYSSNAECAACRRPEDAAPAPQQSRQRVATPGASTIDQVTQMLELPASSLVKTLLYRAGDRFIAALVRGDRELNEMKLGAYLQAPDLRMAEADEIVELTGADVGFAGPVGLPEHVRIIADYELLAVSDFVAGANETDAHYTGVNIGIDFDPDEYADIRNAVDGDACPECDSGALQGLRAIELAHIFKLGTKYSKDIGLLVQNESGAQVPSVMGCYGIGVSRIISAVVEAHNDEKGIVWPPEVAPFQVAVLLLDPQEAELEAIAARLHDEIEAAGFSVLLDDRDERPGVKFKDAELVGYPICVVVGKRTRESGQVELQTRANGEEEKVDAGDAARRVAQLLDALTTTS